MMISWHGNDFSITDPLCGDSTSQWWIPSQRELMQISDSCQAEHCWTNSQASGGFGNFTTLWHHCNVMVMFTTLFKIFKGIVVFVHLTLNRVNSIIFAEIWGLNNDLVECSTQLLQKICKNYETDPTYVYSIENHHCSLKYFEQCILQHVLTEFHHKIVNTSQFLSWKNFNIHFSEHLHLRYYWKDLLKSTDSFVNKD